ncbi:MAG TPA: tRNA (N(6)-L-threonylcarbamoyladenosine(37)-C(2))-methylthiotransferase MtaB [Candidatus Kapabacteria bacterium]
MMERKTGHTEGATPRVSLHTLGCKLNYAETSTLASQFAERGFATVPFDAECDVFLLNTCSVTENAEKECRQIVRRIARRSPNAFIAVTGCYAQLRPEEIASIEGVDLVLGAKEKFNLVKYAGNFEKSHGPRIFASDISEATQFYSSVSSHSNDRTRAFLKIQDGCDYTCAFCTIPKARGASRSSGIQDVLDRARRLSEEGFRETILSGVNIGDFGKRSESTFYELAQALDEDEEITTRIRISSIEPNLLTDEIIELVANSQKFCPHFHLPMQSGSDRILRLMRRRYLTPLYRSRVERIKELMPNACIGADVIVGFPGETNEDFFETCEFIRTLDLSYLHVFTYSERPGTVASTMNNSVPVHIRRERNRLLRTISEKKKRAFYESQIGREVKAVLEPNGEGYSENYVRVKLNRFVPHAELVRVELEKITGDVVQAKLVEVLTQREEGILLPIL